jgi:hypothetical protein
MRDINRRTRTRSALSASGGPGGGEGCAWDLFWGAADARGLTGSAAAGQEQPRVTLVDSPQIENAAS